MNASIVSENKTQHKPSIGWKKDSEGWLYLPDDFAQGTAFISEDFNDWAEKMRVRWNLFEYLKAVLSKKTRK